MPSWNFFLARETDKNMEVSETVYYGGNNRGLEQIIGETHYFKCDGWRGLSGK